MYSVLLAVAESKSGTWNEPEYTVDDPSLTTIIDDPFFNDY